MISTGTATRPHPRHTQQDHAQAFAVVFRKEFGVPCALFDAHSGRHIDLVPSTGEEDSATVLSVTGFPGPDARTPVEVRRQADDGQPAVRGIGPSLYELSLVLYYGGRPAFVAVAAYPGIARTAADADREKMGLRHWLQSFADRLRLSDQFLCQQDSKEEQAARARTAWEGLLSLDLLMRRVRVHKDPGVNQRRILESAYALLGAQALLYVPPDPQAGVIIHGEPLLAPVDCAHLAGMLAKTPGYAGSGLLFCNDAATQSWAVSFPRVATLLAMPICEQQPPGWVIAVNKRCDDGPFAAAAFRKSDAALLTPFVALLRLHHHAATRFQDLRELMVGLARSLTAAIDAKDAYTFGHSERVARIGVELGRALGLDEDGLSDLYLAGLLHDVGKIGVPDAILRKDGPLTDEEFAVVRQHVTIGHSILADLRPIRHLLPGVLCHHERYDGKGYPHGLAGEAIPRIARILAVADAYDAMSMQRPYRAAMALADVEGQLRSGAGTQWDAQVVDAFMRCRQKIHAIRQRGVGESLKQALDGALRSQEPSTHVV